MKTETMTSKQIGEVILKTEIRTELDNAWGKLFDYHMQTMSASSQELRNMSAELSELMAKIEVIQNEYLKPVRIY